MSLRGVTYSTCQPVRKAENREVSIFHSGVIIKFSWLVGNVFRVVCQDIVDRGMIDCHVRYDSTKYLTEFFLGINSCWQTSNLFKRKINIRHFFFYNALNYKLLTCNTKTYLTYLQSAVLTLLTITVLYSRKRAFLQ